MAAVSAIVLPAPFILIGGFLWNNQFSWNNPMAADRTFAINVTQVTSASENEAKSQHDVCQTHHRGECFRGEIFACRLRTSVRGWCASIALGKPRERSVPTSRDKAGDEKDFTIYRGSRADAQCHRLRQLWQLVWFP